MARRRRRRNLLWTPGEFFAILLPPLCASCLFFSVYGLHWSNLLCLGTQNMSCQHFRTGEDPWPTLKKGVCVCLFVCVCVCLYVLMCMHVCIQTYMCASCACLIVGNLSHILRVSLVSFLLLCGRLEPYGSSIFSPRTDAITCGGDLWTGRS